MLTLFIFLCICYIQLCRLRFLSCSLSLYFEFCFWVFKGIGFSFYNYITYFTSFIIAFGNSLCCVFSEWRRGEYSFKIFRLFLAFNDFCYILLCIHACKHMYKSNFDSLIFRQKIGINLFRNNNSLRLKFEYKWKNSEPHLKINSIN